MNDNFMYAMLFLLMVILGARVFTERAMKRLTVEKKAELIDLFSGQRLWVYGVVVVLIVAFFALMKLKLIHPAITAFGYMAILLGLSITMMVVNNNKLTKNGFPKEFVNAYLTSSIIRLVGIIGFLIILLMP